MCEQGDLNSRRQCLSDLESDPLDRSGILAYEIIQ